MYNFDKRMLGGIESSLKRKDHTRKIEGETFYGYMGYSNKRDAETAARNCRAFGVRARVLKEKNYYEVFIRRK